MVFGGFFDDLIEKGLVLVVVWDGCVEAGLKKVVCVVVEGEVVEVVGGDVFELF